MLVSAKAVSQSSDIGAFRAGKMAQQLAKAKKYKNIVNILNLSSQDKNLLYQDLKKTNSLEKSLPSFSYKEKIITSKEGDYSIEIDYRDFSKKILYINGSKVDLSQKISYVHALLKIKQISSKKKAAFFSFIPEAQAKADSNSFDYIWASVVSSDSSSMADLSEWSSKFALEETLVQTYENIIDTASDGTLGGGNGNFELAKKLGPTAHTIFLDRFTCKNNRLHKLSHEEPVFSGERMSPLYANERDYLIFVPGVGYTGSHVSTSQDILKCNFEADLQGKITSITNDSSCAKVGESIFEIAYDEWKTVLYFGDFPKVADSCCKKKGCEAKVNAAIERKLSEYIARVKQSGSKSKGSR